MVEVPLFRFWWNCFWLSKNSICHQSHNTHCKIVKDREESTEMPVGLNKPNGEMTVFHFLLCAQCGSWKWNVKGERPWDWDVDQILTQTGYLKPPCWKLPPVDVAASHDAVFGPEMVINYAKICLNGSDTVLGKRITYSTYFSCNFQWSHFKLKGVFYFIISSDSHTDSHHYAVI